MFENIAFLTDVYLYHGIACQWCGFG